MLEEVPAPLLMVVKLDGVGLLAYLGSPLPGTCRYVLLEKDIKERLHETTPAAQ